MTRELRSHAALDRSSRINKAKKISKIISLDDGDRKKILDIGTGAGYIPHYLAQKHLVTSVDVVDERIEKSDYKYKKVDSANLPFEDEAFDIVISNQVIEHIPDQRVHVSEISRVTKRGGYIYLATPNRYWIRDPHTKLFGINWLPRPLANYYSTIFRKGAWDVFPLTYWELRDMIKDSNLMVEKGSADSLELLNNDTSIKSVFRLLYRMLPHSVLAEFEPLYPSAIFLLKK
jgi:SAM-dependent methyltransferase